MASESNKNRIRKMIALCDELINKCKDRTEDDLYDDINFAEAVCFVLGQIGEQVPGYRVSSDGKTVKENDYDEFYKEFKNVDWNEIKGARNKIYHDYDGVNMSIIWDTLKDIPIFKQKLMNLI